MRLGICFFLMIIFGIQRSSASRLSEWYEKNKEKVDATAQDLLNNLLFKNRDKDKNPNDNKPPEEKPPPVVHQSIVVPVVKTSESPPSTTRPDIPFTTTTPKAKTTTEESTVDLKKSSEGGNSKFSWVWAVSSAVVIAIICCVILLIRWLPMKENISIYDEIMLPPVFVRNSVYLHERIEELEYDRRFEVDRHNLEMGKLIGSGNFGAVYDGTLNSGSQWSNNGILGNSAQTKVTVAIKTAGDASTLEDITLRKKLLEDELKLMCSVGSHPNIVTLFGAVTQINCDGPIQDGNGYAIPMKTFGSSNNYTQMEYETLEKNSNWKTDLSRELTTAHLLSFSMQIAEGMKYLASMKCVHRDLAARNILLTNEGLCKISDFGLAKRIGYQEYYRSERVLQLPERWMAVESLRYRKFTTESDIWSYGILLYEIFSLGGTPYPNLSGLVAEQVINGIRNEQPKYCPDEIYHHMVKCWNEDPERRPQFQFSAALFMKHLVQASTEIFITVQEALKNEAVRQKELQLLRDSKTKGAHIC